MCSFEALAILSMGLKNSSYGVLFIECRSERGPFGLLGTCFLKFVLETGFDQCLRFRLEGFERVILGLMGVLLKCQSS